MLAPPTSPPGPAPPRARQPASPTPPSLAARAQSLLLLLLLALAHPHPALFVALAQNPPAPPPLPITPSILSIEGRVEILRPNARDWSPAQLSQELRRKDRLRTGLKSRATLRLSNQSVLRVNQLTTLEIEAPSIENTDRTTLDLRSGAAYLLSRAAPLDLQFRTPQASGAIRGTEFNLQVDGTGATVVSLFDGLVDLSNPLGTIRLASGDQGVVEPGQGPRRAPILDAVALIQWALYYPGILDPDELNLPPNAQSALGESITAYRQGDLLGAASAYPDDRTPDSDPERLYRAAVYLSVGQVEETLRTLDALTASSPLADALRQVIAAVQGKDWSRSTPPTLTGEWMAESYYLQSKSRLPEALAAARQATLQSPQFGFASARLAELEFSFGRTDAAATAIARALAVSPRNAYAHSLHGFLLAARSRYLDALAAFDAAIRLDPGLGHAWLGRGMVKIKTGRPRDGLDDLQTAAAAEPQRSLFRSYLGKGYAELDALGPAHEELRRAQELDPADPTPGLYLGLLHRRNNQLGAAIQSLEESVARNQNRMIYRSSLLLDRDAAIRRANLSSLYQEAGMTQVALQESARAVAFDPANHSAHLNLAGSYHALRDPTRFDLRYETVWFNEHLLGNLLAPADAAALSQNLSHNEYSALWSSRRSAFLSSTEYFSTGEWRELASYAGYHDRLAYAVDLDLQRKAGVTPNNDLERSEIHARFKADLSQDGSILLLAKLQEYQAGDQFIRFDPRQTDPDFRFDESQPILAFAGYHHRWSPTTRTLFLAGRSETSQRFTDLDTAIQVADRARLLDPGFDRFHLTYRNRYQVNSGEISQWFEYDRHTDIVGVRYQSGRFTAENLLDGSQGLSALGQSFASDGGSSFERVSTYLYHHWRIHENLLLTAGATWDSLSAPLNSRNPPVAPGSFDDSGWSPKAGAVFTPVDWLGWRLAYSQSRAGVSYDESIRLEPTQLAGFPQAYRTLISESIVGSVENPKHEVFATSVELRPRRGTFVTIDARRLLSDVDRSLGQLELDVTDPALTVNTALFRERLRYREHAIGVTLDQMIDQEWFLGLRYECTDSRLRSAYPDIPATPGFDRDRSQDARLHQTWASLRFLHSKGFTARAEAGWLWQEGHTTTAPFDSDFPVLNLYAGWRFPKQRADILLGVLNLTDHLPRLSPLTPFQHLPLERTLYLRLRLTLE